MTAYRSEQPDFDVDVAIVGAGPSGRWLASLLARRDIAVALIDPDLGAQWPNNYGLWLDEVDELVPDACFDCIWPEAAVVTGKHRTVDRAYGRIDNAAFGDHLDTILDGADASRIERRACRIQSNHDVTTLHCAGGLEVRARLVVDASGAFGGLTATNGANVDVPVQRAYGIEAKFDVDPLDGDGFVLMDYRSEPDGSDGPPPTFLYGMNLGDGIYFVEETVLVGADVPFDQLRRRLHRRLRARGATPVEPIRAVERCHIPMGLPIPNTAPGVVPFGACAGLIHPATGYQMGRMLRAGPAVADAIAGAMDGQASSEAIALAAFCALWPADALRARQLLLLGRDVLRSLDRSGLCRFFDAFFSLPDADWRAYLRGDTGYFEISRIMWRLFRRADSGLQWALVQSAFGDIHRLFEAWRPKATVGAPIGAATGDGGPP